MTKPHSIGCKVTFFLNFTAPSGVGGVSPVSQTSSSLTVTWTTPTSPNGLITLYEIAFSPVRTIGLDMPPGSVGRRVVTVSVDIPEMVLIAVASQLQPATTYSVVLMALTSGGIGTGPAVELTTNQSGLLALWNLIS